MSPDQERIIQLLGEIRDLQADQVRLITEIKAMNAETAKKSEASLASTEENLQKALALQTSVGRAAKEGLNNRAAACGGALSDVLRACGIDQSARSAEIRAFERPFPFKSRTADAIALRPRATSFSPTKDSPAQTA